MRALGSNETWGTVVADIIKRGDPTAQDISLILAVLAEKLRKSSDPANVQHVAITDEISTLSSLVRIHFAAL